MSMNINSREKDVEAKQEGESIEQSKIPSRASSTSTTTRQWAGFRNPRIVRVSRAFGGKDRHSKVCTIRGLRDRRIRLSVPTAIQLYDLQDRLGLNQPSKVVDWLLDATKNEIDKLPPLQIPSGSFADQFHHPAIATTNHQASLSQLFLEANSSADMKGNGGAQTLFSSRESLSVNNPDADIRDKCKQGEREAASIMEKFKWMNNAANEQEKLENYGGYVAQFSAQNFLQLANQSSFSGLLNNAAFPYNTYFHLDPSFNHSFTFQQAEDSQNVNHSLAFPSPVALSSGSQLHFCPPAAVMTTPPSSVSPHMIENDQQRQINHLQLLSSTSSTSQNNIVPPNPLIPTLHLMSSSQEKDDSQQNKGGSGS